MATLHLWHISILLPPLSIACIHLLDFIAVIGWFGLESQTILYFWKCLWIKKLVFYVILLHKNPLHEVACNPACWHAYILKADIISPSASQQLYKLKPNHPLALHMQIAINPELRHLLCLLLFPRNAHSQADRIKDVFYYDFPKTWAPQTWIDCNWLGQEKIFKDRQ